MLPGETIASGAQYNGTCPDCHEEMPIIVLRSGAGHYIGTSCPNCGPYSRESGYYPNLETAQKALEQGAYAR